MTIYTAGSETPFTGTNGNVGSFDRTVLSDGGWLATWSDDTGVHQQRYSAEGLAIGQAYSLTANTDSTVPRVAVLSDGGWAVTWQEYKGGAEGYDIAQQRFDPAGIPAFPAETQVNVTTNDLQGSPAITALPDGGWVIVWESIGQDGAGGGIYQQRFDEDGHASSTADLLVNGTTAGVQANPSLTALSDGGWLVTWSSYIESNQSFDIYQQRFTAAGDAVWSEDSRINTILPFHQDYSSVTALADGGWVVTWESTDESSDLTINICQQRFDRDGHAVSDVERLVNATSHESQRSEPIVEALSDGGWVIAWLDVQEDRVYQQAFDRDGHAASVSDTLIGHASDLQAVTALPDGSWVITWGLENEDGGSDIHQQRFVTNTAPSDLVLNGSTVAEESANGTVIGTLTGTDENVASGDSLTYSLVDDAGGRFALQGNKLVVADGLRLDHEQAQSHVVTIRVSDRDGAFFESAFVVQVSDIIGESGPDHWVGTNGADFFNGLGGNDVLFGLGGNDRLFGDIGNDTIHSGAGKDVLAGGAGRDVFVFDTKLNKKTNVDKITDFNVKDDTIWLENAIFTGLGRKGSVTKPAKLDSKMFWKGNAAHDANDHIIVSKSGKIYYDADGTGHQAQIQIGTVTAKAAKGIIVKDFFVI